MTTGFIGVSWNESNGAATIAAPIATETSHAPVVVPSDGNTATSPSPGELADTGATGAGMTMLLGLLIVASGGFLVVRAKRRHIPRRA